MNKKKIIISKLRDHGVKVTPQRVAIIDYLEKNKIHPTAEDIYNSVINEYPSISLATVYNTLDKLEEIKQIIKIKIADENKVNYEYDFEPHYHFYCKLCKKIYDIDIPCEYSKKEEIEGHKIEEVHGYFRGICKNCRKINNPTASSGV